MTMSFKVAIGPFLLQVGEHDFLVLDNVRCGNPPDRRTEQFLLGYLQGRHEITVPIQS